MRVLKRSLAEHDYWKMTLKYHKVLMKVMRSEMLHLQHEESSMNEKIKDNKEKIKLNKQLPYLVSNVVEVCLCSKHRFWT